MKRIRVIPVLLIKGDGLVKPTKFKDHKYVGDPINAVKIFNEKEVDELAIIDIGATKDKRGPNIRKIADIASEAFMPLAYGGGISTIGQVRELLFNGIEKVILNKAAHTTPTLITDIARKFGAQSVVVSLDVKKNLWGKYRVYTDNGVTDSKLSPEEFARKCEDLGAGEIILQSIDKECSYSGYDIDIIKKVSESVTIPVIASGGAAKIEDFKVAVIDGKASAVAAGSMFIFQRPHNAVLISYPDTEELKSKLYSFL